MTPVTTEAPPSLALLSPNAELDARLRAVSGHDSDLRRWQNDYTAGDPARIAAELAEDGVGVVCIGPELDGKKALALAEAFDLDHPDVSVVLLPAQADHDLWDGALRVGVRGVVTIDSPDDELRSVISGAIDAASRRRRAAVAPAEPKMRPRTIVVIGPKGGAGKTMVSVNLAVDLAKAKPGEVALIDLDLQFGDVPSSLQLEPEHTLADIVRSRVPLDGTALKVYLTPHPSGLWALAGPDQPQHADDIDAGTAGEIVRVLSGEFPLVVVDTSAGLDEPTLAALEHATDILLVSTMDVSSIRALRKELDVLEQLGINEPRRHLMLNRADSKVGLNVRDVEAVLGMSVDLAVPSSRTVPLAVNQGVPLIESDPRGPVTRQLEAFATRFTAKPPRNGTNGTGGFRRRKEAR